MKQTIPWVMCAIALTGIAVKQHRMWQAIVGNHETIKGNFEVIKGIHERQMLLNGRIGIYEDGELTSVYIVAPTYGPETAEEEALASEHIASEAAGKVRATACSGADGPGIRSLTQARRGIRYFTWEVEN